MRTLPAGFTLVEILAVVALLALLMALTFPGVRQAFEEGKATQCLSNLRQLAAANHAYAGDHDGQYVPAQAKDNLTRWHGVRGSIDSQFNPDRGPLAPYLGHDGRVKMCPSLHDVLKGSLSFEDGSGGYGYNAAYIGGTPTDPWSAERTARVEHAALAVMFTDTAFPRAEGLQEYAYTEPWQVEYPVGRFRGRLSASVHFRHLGRASVAWCDGHVSAEKPTQIDGINGYGGDAAQWGVGWFGPSEQNGCWRPY